MTEDAGDSGVYDSGKWDTSIEHDAGADVLRDADAAEAAVTDATADADAGPCDGAAERVFYLDRDGDGHGWFATYRVGCEPPDTGSWVTAGDDCHDDNADVYRGQLAFFPEPYVNLKGAYSFDYDCSGTEEAAGSQLIAPSVCNGLVCGMKGFIPTVPRPVKPEGIVDEYCGSNKIRECNLLGCGAQEYTSMVKYVCR